MSEPGSPAGWQRLSGREVYGNPWMRVLEDRVVRPDGTPGVYGVVEVRRPAVFVVALTEADEVLLVRQVRYTVGDSWEVPAGGSDGQEPLVAARRELVEETGYEADAWEHVGEMDALNGLARAPQHVFVARGLRHVGDDGGRAEEGITEVAAVPWAQLLAMPGRGLLRDGETLGALLLAAVHLGRVG